MATNSLQLFGEQLQSSYTSSDKGVAFTDAVWNTASSNNSTIRKSGFIPGSGVSSIALNTALRQAAFGSKIIGDILSTTSITDLNKTVSSDGDIQTKSSALSSALINYLAKINKLINGSVEAGISDKASNYASGGNIETAINTLGNDINTAVQEANTKIDEEIANYNEFKNGVINGTQIVYKAKNYASGGTIDSKFSNIESRVNSLENIYTNTFDIPKASNNDFTVYSDITINSCSFKYVNNIIYGKLNLSGTITKNKSQVFRVYSSKLPHNMITTAMSGSTWYISLGSGRSLTCTIGPTVENYGFYINVTPSSDSYTLSNSSIIGVIIDPNNNMVTGI